MSRLRVLGATLLLVGAVVTGVVAGVGASAPAGAVIACPGTDVPSSARAAKAIFTGVVTESIAMPRADGLRGEAYTQTVQVERVYKGGLDGETAVVQTDRLARQPCQLGQLAVGTTYVFFVDGDAELWLAFAGGGTAVSTDALVASVEQIRGAGRDPSPPEQETATFTRMDVDPPATLARLAAPGAALVLAGLLGLLVVGRLGRRTA